MRGARFPAGAALIACVACAPAEHDDLEGTWRMDPRRSVYVGSAEARRDETFTCRTRAGEVRCTVVAVRMSGDTTRAELAAVPGEGAGTVTGVDGVDRLLLIPREDGYDAVFLDGTEAVLGYRLTPHGDSLVIRTTDPNSGDLLQTRIVYTRSD